MIVSRLGNGQLLVVRQSDHGVQAGLISSAWGNDEIAPVTNRRAATIAAATHHEDGWKEWEQHPTLDSATGHPVQFHAVAPDEHVPAYRKGIAMASARDPWTGLLVSMHGAGLYNDRYGTYRLEEIGEQALTDRERLLVHEFLADMLALQGRLYTDSVGHAAITAPHQDAEVLEAYLLLQVWDRISLQFAFRQAIDGTIRPLPLGGGRDGALACRSAGRMTMTLDPYPFAEDVAQFPVLACTVADRRYTDPEDFLAELANADPDAIACTALRPRDRI
jgi:hypothetical protein